MKNKILNKFNLIISLLVAIILGFGSSVFASFDFTYNNINYSLPDINSNTLTELNENTNFIIFDSDGWIKLELFDDTSIVFFNESNRCLCTTIDAIVPEYYKSPDMDYWKINNRGLIRGGWLDGRETFGNIIYSSFDLKNQNNEVVFQGAPQEVTPEIPEIPETVGLATIVEQAETEKTLAEIVGILPVIMITLVSIIAIRKAISFLKSVLKTS